jgi:hypothetical protein
MSLDRKLAPILDQGRTLRCTGYGTAANGFYIHGKEFSPDWQAYIIGKIQGRSVDDNGGDPNATMKSMRDYGFLPKSQAPFSLQKDGTEGSGFNAPWPSALETEAKTWDTIPGFVRVDGPYDTFDNIWNALCMAWDEKTERGPCVDAFGRWFTEWTYVEVIPTDYQEYAGAFGGGGNSISWWRKLLVRLGFGSLAGYHRYIFLDKIWRDGIEYLLAQNSYGKKAGRNGYHLFPREVVNREFSKWGTSLKIVKTLTKGQMEEAKKETDLGWAWRLFLQAWYFLSEKAGTAFGRIAGTDPRLPLFAQLLQLISQLLNTPPAPQNGPVEPPKPPTPALDKAKLLERMLDAIQDFEGFYAPEQHPKYPNGTRSWRNKNPGNLKWANQAKAIGKDDKGFAKFANVTEGRNALKAMILNAASGKSKVYKPGMTLLEFFSKFAPSTDHNNPAAYTLSVSKKMGVPTTFVISNLV